MTSETAYIVVCQGPGLGIEGIYLDITDAEKGKRRAEAEGWQMVLIVDRPLTRPADTM